MFPRVRCVHVWGGFPCVHLSSARHGRLNLAGAGSNLFFALVQIIRWSQQVWEPDVQVEFIVENVASMDVSARDQISRELDVTPLRLDPADIQLSRPRLAWVSFPVHAGPGVTLVQAAGFIEVRMSGYFPAGAAWVETGGWERVDDSVPFPTFMKAIVRDRPPPVPAGISRCPPATLQRWRSSGYKFPPYQFKEKFLLVDGAGNLRTLRASERECLMGMGPGATQFCLPAGEAKRFPHTYEDKRLSLLGDGFAMLSFGWVCGQACRQFSTPLDPSQLVQRFGLAPGAGLHPSARAPLVPGLHYGGSPSKGGPLVPHVARSVHTNGSDVCVALGLPYSNKVQQHASLRALWWDWRILFTTRWGFWSHINALEMRMILQALAWRARNPESYSKRWLHLADSMVSGHRTVLAGRSVQERCAAREHISLRDSGITLRTQQRYHAALNLLLPFISDSSSKEEMGEIIEEWVEAKWYAGATLGQVGDSLCALQYYWPDSKPHLKSAWRLYKIWRRLEVPCRAPPLSALIVRAFVNFLVDHEEVAAAFLIALGFHAYLRTGELLSLRFRDLQLGTNRGVVTIRGGKSGLRHNIDEAVALYDPLVLQLGQLARLLPRHTNPNSIVWPFHAKKFRDTFAKCVSHFELQALEYKPYSLRRGGATHDYIAKGLLEPILLRGRWHSLAVARLYIEDGLAQLPQLCLSPPTLTRLRLAAAPFSTLIA
eukprot:Skav211322  [mRNA]  locus=scaffold3035:16954:19240:- [translate_table: standard]